MKAATHSAIAIAAGGGVGSVGVMYKPMAPKPTPNKTSRLPVIAVTAAAVTAPDGLVRGFTEKVYTIFFESGGNDHKEKAPNFSLTLRFLFA
jgi:hypothetical protein